MKIAILMLTTEQYNANQFYNSQAEGMAKAFVKYGHDVIVYHLIPDLQQKSITHTVDGILIQYLKVRHLGKHALVPLEQIDKTIQFLIVCADNYLGFSKVYKWANGNKIPIAPYIGVLRSNNASKWKRIVMDIICNNISLYRKIPTIVKTPAIQKELLQNGARDVTVIPVGLDETILKSDYLEYSIEKLKEKWGYTSEEKILLFIGRMTAEKNPVGMLNILDTLLEKQENIRLLMVGKGELEALVEQEIERRNLQNYIQWIKQIDNDKIWELYRISDWFVNLNGHEIFGMAILEAMYYGCPVVALHGPGPDYIITDGMNGYLCDTEEEIISGIAVNDRNIIGQAKNTIFEKFLWQSIVPQFLRWKEKNYDRKM